MVSLEPFEIELECKVVDDKCGVKAWICELSVGRTRWRKDKRRERLACISQ